MPVIAAAIIGGAVVSGISAANAQESANKRNVALSRENRDVQIDLANTAHQREVADLRAAGLNPILSGTGGAGAAVPSSAAAVVGAADPLKGVGSSVSSAMMASQQMELLRAQTKKTAFEAEVAEDASTKSGIDIENYENYQKFIERNGLVIGPDGTPVGTAVPGMREDLFRSQFKRDVGEGEFASQRVRNMRQELENLVLQHGIGQSALSKSKILDRIYDMGFDALEGTINLFKKYGGKAWNYLDFKD